MDVGVSMSESCDTEKYPRLRDGYPSLAAWIAHDPDSESYVFRRFDRLSARNLLYMQSGLIELERRIDEWDNMAWRSQNSHLPLSMRRWEKFEELARDPQQPEYVRIKERQDLDASLKKKIQNIVGHVLISIICSTAS